MNNWIQASRRYSGAPRLALFILMGTALLSGFSNARAQAGGKDSQKFLDYSEGARDALVDARFQLASTVGLYNTLIAGEAERPESSYKKLVKALEKGEKLAEKVGDRVEKMQKQADDVFRTWAQELEGYDSEQLKELGEPPRVLRRVFVLSQAAIA